jgi:hypothetical protein
MIIGTDFFLESGIPGANLERHVDATSKRPPSDPHALRLVPEFHRHGDVGGNCLPVLGCGFVLVAL